MNLLAYKNCVPFYGPTQYVKKTRVIFDLAK